MREIQEEVGVRVKESLEYVLSTAFVTDRGQPVVDVVFLCEYDSGVPAAVSPDEVEAVYWMTAEEIYAHPKAPVWLKENVAGAERVRKETAAHMFD